MTVTIYRFQDHVNGFKNSNLSRNESLSNWALGLAGEAGEVVDCIKKSLYHGKGFDDLDPVAKELGDLLWYIFALADELDLSIENIMQTNINKLQTRHEGESFDITAANKNKALEVIQQQKDPRFHDWSEAQTLIDSYDHTVVFNSENFDQIIVIDSYFDYDGDPIIAVLNMLDHILGGDWLSVRGSSQNYLTKLIEHFANKGN